jgi:hypothetical protein
MLYILSLLTSSCLNHYTNTGALQISNFLMAVCFLQSSGADTSSPYILIFFVQHSREADFQQMQAMHSLCCCEFVFWIISVVFLMLFQNVYFPKTRNIWKQCFIQQSHPNFFSMIISSDATTSSQNLPNILAFQSPYLTHLQLLMALFSIYHISFSKSWCADVITCACITPNSWVKNTDL